jgi:hypothetical protein
MRRHRHTPPDRPGSIINTESDWHPWHKETGTFAWTCHECREALADELENKALGKALRNRAPGT